MGATIQIQGKPVAGGKVPLVCTPLVGRSREEVLAELAVVTAKKPDLLEWRVDFFEGIGRTGEVIELAGAIRRAAGAIPIILTRRSAAEGGERVPITEEQVVELYSAACASRCVDLVDYELSNPPEHLRRVRQASRDHGVQLIASFHDFQRTPPPEAIFEKLADAERRGADVAKVAVMPRSLEDVLTLLAATLRARRELRLPLISMSMGAYGSLTRMFGWAFGSAVTFAVGKAASAPGQVPIEELNVVLDILRRSLGGAQL